MSDFIGFTDFSEHAHNDNGHAVYGNGEQTLYRLMQHAIYWRGSLPVATDRIIGPQLTGAIDKVREWEWRYLPQILYARAEVHDLSKYFPPEEDTFRIYTPKLKMLTYGSDEYKAALVAMGPGLKHHYAVNSHHPEHYQNGVDDMSFTDIVEMFCDWVAACDKKQVKLDIGQQAQRFKIDSGMAVILQNTLEYLRDWTAEHNVPSWA